MGIAFRFVAITTRKNIYVLECISVFKITIVLSSCCTNGLGLGQLTGILFGYGWKVDGFGSENRRTELMHWNI